MVRVGAAEEPVRNVMLRCTQAFNVSGHPRHHTSVRQHNGRLTTEGLPMGAQIIGVYQDTAGLLQVARAVESVVAGANRELPRAGEIPLRLRDIRQIGRRNVGGGTTGMSGGGESMTSGTPSRRGLDSGGCGCSNMWSAAATDLPSTPSRLRAEPFLSRLGAAARFCQQGSPRSALRLGVGLDPG